MKPTPVPRSVAHVAEHHRLHVGGGADVVGNLFHVAVVVGFGVPPAAEHGVARHGKLLARIFGKGLVGFFLDELLVIGDDGLQVVGGEVGIELGLDLRFARIEDVVELLHVDIERDFAEHLDEAAIAIVGETLVAALRGEAGGGLVVQAQVQDGVHHAGHGELRAGANAEQQRIDGIAQLLAHLLFELREGVVDFLLDLRGDWLLFLK